MLPSGDSLAAGVNVDPICRSETDDRLAKGLRRFDRQR